MPLGEKTNTDTQLSEFLYLRFSFNSQSFNCNVLTKIQTLTAFTVFFSVCLFVCFRLFLQYLLQQSAQQHRDALPRLFAEKWIRGAFRFSSSQR